MESLLIELQQITSFDPSDSLSKLFGELISIINTFSHDERCYLAKKYESTFSQIQAISSRCEFQLEKYWATNILALNKLNLSSFPYYENYIKMELIERGLISAFAPHSTSLLLIGAGPLPLSSLLHEKSFERITSIDLDSDAASIGQRIVNNFTNHNLQHDYININILNFNKICDYDTIIMAGLVGDSKNRNYILSYISKYMKKGAILIVRSGNNLKRFFYPELKLNQFQLDLRVLCFLDPQSSDILNSLTILKKE